ncbi:MAG: hypothetical protein UV63_C0006G0022 [Microgenomates group bacterium GW2011_GWC1_43_11]|uniref:FemAB family protein n=2 Tax=Candidatus Gottesmaniibacteriota TaxID=1752720 RepID=A0A0G1IN23_9BACT|nr:MAG: hypothetical protein UV63_C0006G0022 [Microgenomates group bacterium GW2011_GWC1_43_11]KKT38620.1 MAG: hypothetical protein UW22_C0009G0026 [Candidatus Gottesmanbacteria bacterium GW2011_GWB1_44_11c]KKT60811.1 MAG: hypothetical protein UW52_C0017G0022 [Candidatus Gottesmanbacteria bacterium GW2011_GWA1_44_24b]
MELQQSSLYKTYIERLRWTVVTLDGVNIFLKHIPFFGVLAKIQRPPTLPYIPKLILILQKHNVRNIILEPTIDTDPIKFQESLRSLSKFFNIHKEPFLPTKTLLVDLTQSEKDIFRACTEAKQRGVRRAQKHGVIVKESKSIKDLMHIKNKSAGFLGGITTYGIDKLWDLFSPNHATILLAYAPSSRPLSRDLMSTKKMPYLRQLADRHDNIIGGVLLLFWDHIAYYWIAGATKNGKKLFAPTFLVWEALKLSKKRGNKQFDFVGVFDERSPKQFTSWHGFTKFKEGFGGKPLYYPIPPITSTLRR